VRRAIAAAMTGLFVMTAAPLASAQSPEKLAAARKLFAEALHEEQEKHFDTALDKFRAVQQTKNTMAVRYRIASCEEGVGQLRRALTDFRAIGDETGAADAEEQGIVKSAKDKAIAIDERIPKLTVQLSARAPGDATVTVDDERLGPAAMRGDPVPLDPGEHEVRATATGATAFASRVSMREQARVALQIPLDPVDAARPEPPKPPPPPPPPEAPRTVGYVLLGTAGLFAVATTVTLLLRASDIGTLNDACPGGRCPTTREQELTSVRSRALTEGPVALVFAGVAALAGAAGVYFVLAPGKTPDAPVAALGPFDLRGSF
jgi:hypothetical protein